MMKITKTRPPVPLDKEQTYLYKYIVKFLTTNNAFSDVDSLTIAEAVKCYFRMLEFEKDATNKGWTISYDNGSNLSPEATLFYREQKAWNDYCKLFGLTVKARDTIKIFKSDTGGKKGLLRSLAAMHQAAANG